MNTQLNEVKALLSQAEDDYSFAIARGDWEACSAAKSKVAKLRRQVAKIIKQQLKPSFA